MVTRRLNPIPLDDFPMPGRPWTNIAPFTYRDGSTYLKVLEDLRAYIFNVLVPHINSELDGYGDEWDELFTEFQTAVIESFNQLAEEFDIDRDAFRADIQALVDQWTTVQIENNDIITAAIIADPASATSGQLTDTFVQIENNDADTAAFIADPASATSGQLSAAIDGQVVPLLQAVRNLSSAVLLGDSRTQYNGNYIQSQALSTAVTHDDRGYVSCAMVLLRQRLDILRNGGVGGDTVAQMLARTDDLLALGPGWLIGFGCINSVNQDVPAASIIADLTAIFDKCAAAGVRVVWGTDWISSSTNTPARKQAAATVNEWLRREASRRREFYLADYAAVMSDPATGLPVAEYASDGLHQDGPGGFIMAQELVKVLEPLLPPMDRLTVSNEDTTNVLINGMLEGDGGTGRATSWQWPGSGPVTFEKVARTDGYQGDWQQVTVTGEVATQSPFYQQVAAADGRWAEGDRVFFECEFETDAEDWLSSEFSARLSLIGVTGTAPQIVADDMNHAAGVPGQSYRPERGIFRTPVLRIHEGTTHIQAGIRFVGTGTFRIARARVVTVT